MQGHSGRLSIVHIALFAKVSGPKMKPGRCSSYAKKARAGQLLQPSAQGIFSAHWVSITSSAKPGFKSAPEHIVLHTVLCPQGLLVYNLRSSPLNMDSCQTTCSQKAEDMYRCRNSESRG